MDAAVRFSAPSPEEARRFLNEIITGLFLWRRAGGILRHTVNFTHMLRFERSRIRGVGRVRPTGRTTKEKAAGRKQESWWSLWQLLLPNT